MISVKGIVPTSPPESKLDRIMGCVRKTAAKTTTATITLRHTGMPARRTTMSLDTPSWRLLDHIAQIEGLEHRDALISRIEAAFYGRDIPLTHLVREFLLTWCAEDILLDIDAATKGGLAEWHAEEARRAEDTAKDSPLPLQRSRLRNAARMHRQSAALALKDL
ncbi:ribbon-helix-helix domain-containing protein [Azospirillum griseum]|nr:ribbon-helix-helix domain-containing protein [Azospirillum griseum]